MPSVMAPSAAGCGGERGLPGDAGCGVAPGSGTGGGGGTARAGSRHGQGAGTGREPARAGSQHRRLGDCLALGEGSSAGSTGARCRLPPGHQRPPPKAGLGRSSWAVRHRQRPAAGRAWLPHPPEPAAGQTWPLGPRTPGQSCLHCGALPSAAACTVGLCPWLLPAPQVQCCCLLPAPRAQCPHHPARTMPAACCPCYRDRARQPRQRHGADAHGSYLHRPPPGEGGGVRGPRHGPGAAVQAAPLPAGPCTLTLP